MLITARKGHNINDWLKFGHSPERKYFDEKDVRKNNDTFLLFLNKIIYLHGQVEKFPSNNYCISQYVNFVKLWRIK